MQAGDGNPDRGPLSSDAALLSGYSAPFKSAYNDAYTDPSNG